MLSRSAPLAGWPVSATLFAVKYKAHAPVPPCVRVSMGSRLPTPKTRNCLTYGPSTLVDVAIAMAELCAAFGHSAAYSETAMIYLPETLSQRAEPPDEVV